VHVPFTQDENLHLPSVISTPRFQTYLTSTAQDRVKALELYQWNLEISAAFMIPLQVCEVSTRNGILTAIETAYGLNWHQSQTFKNSLPKNGYYKPYRDFEKTSANLVQRHQLSPGKIVAELKFVFWEYMMTARHDTRLWRPYFNLCFPNIQAPWPSARANVRDRIETVRGLRNRIAHHEPIFSRPLAAEYAHIIELIDWRNPTAATWVQKIQNVTTLLAAKPIP
jgi:hypothetical protein